MQKTYEERLARLRAHLHSALLGSGKSVGQMANELGIASSETLSAYLSGREPLPVWVLLKLAELTQKPIWWFFDEPPQGITLESADIALQNISRIKLYLEAVETEFQLVSAKHRREPTFTSLESSVEWELDEPQRELAEVVDCSKYLNRARMILSKEVDSKENEVSEESVEMVAHGLLSAEKGRPVRRNSYEALN